MKVMTLDGNSLAYRAFYALPEDMSNASGQSTNAVYGFTTMLVNLLKEHRPDAVLVVFDRPEPTFRHQAIPEYKAQREKAPDTLFQQLGLIRELLDALGVSWAEMAGFEGDDLIATVADAAAAQGHDVLIVTGDRDSYQLVRDPHIKVLYNKRGVSDYALYDEAGIVERTGVTAEQYPDYAALRGDPSDNLDGVPGVGEKTAAKLIQQFGSIGAVVDNAASQTPKLKTNLQEHGERVIRNAEMMRLRRDVPMELSFERWRPVPDLARASKMFDFLEFKTMQKRFTDVVKTLGWSTAGADAELVIEGAPIVAVREVTSYRDESALVESLAVEGRKCVAGLFDDADDPTSLSGLVILTDPAGGIAGLWPTAVLTSKVAKSALESASGLAAHDAKRLLRAFLALGIDVSGLEMDTAIAAYLVNPSKSGYSLAEVALDILGVEVAQGAADEGQFDFGTGDTGSAVARAAEETSVVAALIGPLNEMLVQAGNESLYREMENPLVRVLAKMEHCGIAVDTAVLSAIRDRLTRECAELTSRLFAVAGREFNVNSPAQLREILFVEKGLSPVKKTKTGFSTDAATLEKLEQEWPEFIGPLLRFREVEKLRSTYAEGLLQEVAPDGRIHATFQQTVARTGRLSSDHPNLHNIPVRSDEGRIFRTAFVAPTGSKLLVADYNQIELRCIAHLADDPGLIAAFEAGEDIHNATAARVFGVSPDEVTHDQRSKAKMVSYGLAYGMEAYGLSQRLGIGVEEASVILHSYFEAFPAVKKYMDDAVQEARKLGYTRTLFGRRRPIEELRSDNFRVRQAGERQAMNAAIQGLAADIFKIALVRIEDRLSEGGHAARVVLQVHDEVIVEVPDAETDVVGPLVLETMRGAASLKVPLEVNAAWGESWAEAKD